MTIIILSVLLGLSVIINLGLGRLLVKSQRFNDKMTISALTAIEERDNLKAGK